MQLNSKVPPEVMKITLSYTFVENGEHLMDFCGRGGGEGSSNILASEQKHNEHTLLAKNFGRFISDG